MTYKKQIPQQNDKSLNKCFKAQASEMATL